MLNGSVKAWLVVLATVTSPALARLKSCTDAPTPICSDGDIVVDVDCVDAADGTTPCNQIDSQSGDCQKTARYSYNIANNGDIPLDFPFVEVVQRVGGTISDTTTYDFPGILLARSNVDFPPTEEIDFNVCNGDPPSIDVTLEVEAVPKATPDGERCEADDSYPFTPLSRPGCENEDIGIAINCVTDDGTSCDDIDPIQGRCEKTASLTYTVSNEDPVLTLEVKSVFVYFGGRNYNLPLDRQREEDLVDQLQSRELGPGRSFAFVDVVTFNVCTETASIRIAPRVTVRAVRNGDRRVCQNGLQKQCSIDPRPRCNDADLDIDIECEDANTGAACTQIDTDEGDCVKEILYTYTVQNEGFRGSLDIISVNAEIDVSGQGSVWFPPGREDEKEDDLSRDPLARGESGSVEERVFFNACEGDVLINPAVSVVAEPVGGGMRCNQEEERADPFRSSPIFDCQVSVDVECEVDYRIGNNLFRMPCDDDRVETGVTGCQESAETYFEYTIRNNGGRDEPLQLGAVTREAWGLIGCDPVASYEPETDLIDTLSANERQIDGGRSQILREVCYWNLCPVEALMGVTVRAQAEPISHGDGCDARDTKAFDPEAISTPPPPTPTDASSSAPQQ